MFGLEYVMAGYFHLASASVECKLKKPPEIKVSASDTSVRFDHTKSQAQMNNLQNDTVSPYGPNVQTHVGGLMSGEISISQNLRLMQETWPNINAGCLYLDSLQIKIHIKPTIYIAREYLKTGCMYHAIMEHEKKHIAVDRQIVNKYTALIAKGVDAALKKIGYAHGPFRIGEIPQRQKEIQEFVKTMVQGYSDQMNAERQRLQQAVDTLEEYERVQAQCRGKK